MPSRAVAPRTPDGALPEAGARGDATTLADPLSFHSWDHSVPLALAVQN
ncbi:Uncharacterised protein [Mycobacteroides abscessus]|nr:Uncharacterised protein [Mycobacteroides abscessus]